MFLVPAILIFQRLFYVLYQCPFNFIKYSFLPTKLTGYFEAEHFHYGARHAPCKACLMYQMIIFPVDYNLHAILRVPFQAPELAIHSFVRCWLTRCLSVLEHHYLQHFFLLSYVWEYSVRSSTMLMYS